MQFKESLIRFTLKAKHVLFLEIAIYTILFSFFAISKYFALQTYAFDLGIYNQVLHSTLFDGKLLYSPVEVLANPSGCTFGIHFSPILLTILPIYAIHPGPTTLLVFQTFVIALGALPLYLLASRRLSSERWGLLFSTMYLLNPAVQGINWFDFHPEAFLPTLILFALYFFDAKKTTGFVVSVLLALMCIEYASVVILFMCLFFLVKMKPWEKHAIDIRKMWLLSFTVLISLVWLIMSLQIIRFFNPLVHPMTGEIYWREIGADSLLDVPSQVVQHPVRVINALLFEGGAKFAYVAILLGSLAFLPVLEPLIFICVFPWLATALLSNFPPFYQFGDQYPAFIIAFLFYGAVLGMQKLQSLFGNSLSKKKVRMIAVFLFCLSFVFCCVSTPLNSAPLASSSYFSYGFPEISQHDRAVLKVLELLPPDASVLTQNNIFPLLSNRLEAYLFPSNVHYPPGKSLRDAIYDVFDKVDFVIVDFEGAEIAAPAILSYASSYGHFGLYASIDGAIMLKRNYSGLPVYFKPIELVYDFKSLTLVNGALVEDINPTNGYAFVHLRSNCTSDFWRGPYVLLPPGKYQATFSLKISNPSEGELIHLCVSRVLHSISVEYLGTDETGYDLRFRLGNIDGDILTSRTISAPDFPRSDDYSNFTIDFSVDNLGSYEFRGYTPSSDSDVFLEEIYLAQTEASSNLTLQVQESFLRK